MLTQHKIMVTAVTELSELYHALVCQWGIQWSDESAVEKFDWIASEVLVGYLQPDYVLRYVLHWCACVKSCPWEPRLRGVEQISAGLRWTKCWTR